MGSFSKGGGLSSREKTKLCLFNKGVFFVVWKLHCEDRVSLARTTFGLLSKSLENLLFLYCKGTKL